ncbi:hypothetical protein A2572_03525 [Candidatus Collierbacteria bacterium RIFOXYD1_FULL_40_9]|uniref:DDH domain-containing protein n=1 Tax=Candidatus Collierbacteria bacterium RIFOXYD1_FULL_40_9 TaxID=1817731 RepID=A0A1F5FUN8_9BACT|nr:MAG: hypothetical protein A2572_03525 [Candidatus Collierbacteria bacterium RIFOXYD1_FULL_40_9]
MEENGQSGLKDLFNSLNSFLIVLPPDPDTDLVSSALPLHLALKNSNKQSQVSYSGTLPPLDNLYGHQELSNSVGNKNLHISFDFLESNLEKVDYEVDHLGKFSIVVHPKEGSPAPDSTRIKFSYSGAFADLVIVFAVSSLEELGPVYAQEKKFLDSAKVLCISNHLSPVNFTGNVFQQPNVNYAEIVTSLIQKTNLKISPEAASNLIQTIYNSTGNLTHPKVGATTFESLAFLLRHGGHIPGRQAQPLSPFSFPQPPLFSQPMIPVPTESNEEDDSPVPPDWQMPKIFRANNDK